MTVIERLLTFLNAIPDDKVRHALLGAAGVSACASVLLLWLPLLWAVGLTAILLIAAALGKERYDAAHSEIHTADPFDALATLLGGLLVLIPVLLTHWR